MKRTTNLTCFGLLLAVLTILPGTAGSFNSYANMLTMTQTWNQNLWGAQRDLQRVIEQGEKAAASSSSPSPSAAAPAQTFSPPQVRYPIYATDFQSTAWRQAPEFMLNAMGGTPQQKAALRLLFQQLLADYEKTHRKNNLSWAIVYAVCVSLQVDRRRNISIYERDYLISYMNNGLAVNAQFQAMAPGQKQLVYESTVITGGLAAALYLEGRDQKNVALQAQAREIARSVLKQWAGM